jgi:3-hydroxyisobutyrate dehydrogenase-like beta-hydroxyacid dehydrogenase
MVNVGFIGAGQLGEPMVLRLLTAGHHVTVVARRHDVRVRLGEAGATVADSVADATSDSDIVIGCLFSDDQLREVALGPDGLLAHARPGTVFVSHTTGAVSTLSDMAAAGAPEVEILDAPVSGTADNIAAGNLTVMVGGSADSVERVRPVVAAYADPIVATGTLGSALNIKLVNNILFAANAQLIAAAIEVAKNLGVDSSALLDTLAVCSGDSKAAEYVRQTGGIDGFAKLAGPFLRKDIAAARSAAADVHADLGLVARVIAMGPLDLAPKSPSA